MLAIQSVILSSIIGIILAYIIYANGYKIEGIKLFRGIIKVDILYIILVFVIGLIPMV